MVTIKKIARAYTKTEQDQNVSISLPKRNLQNTKEGKNAGNEEQPRFKAYRKQKVM